MADTITCNVYSRHIWNDKRWIPSPISKESPQLSVELTIEEILELLTHSEVWVCDASNDSNINTNNLNKYFPDFIPPYNRRSSEGGGGVTSYTQLSDKPSINGSTINGDMSGDDLGLVSGIGVKSITVLTQEEYDVITPDENTLYIIKGASS